MTAHKHAKLMLQYAQDAAETDKPWETVARYGFIVTAIVIPTNEEQ